MTILQHQIPLVNVLSQLPPGYPRDTIVLSSSALLAAILLLAVGRLRNVGVLNSIAARKIVHVSCAPLWVITWTFYTNDTTSRYYAAALPMTVLICVIFKLGGLNRMVGREKVMAPMGDGGGESSKGESEGMEGIAWYLVMMMSVALLGWRKEVAGVVAISMMSFGDGVAEVVGRKWGDWGRWWGEDKKGKSFAGTAAFVVAGWIGSLGLLKVLNALGMQACNGVDNVWQIGVIAAVCAFVELIPGINDNIAVPAVAALLTKFLH